MQIFANASSQIISQFGLEQYVDGIPVHAGRSAFVGIKAASTTTFECPATTIGNICADDCSTLLTCSSSTTPFAASKCSDLNAGLPICNANAKTCSDKSVDSTCEHPTSDFVCLDTGYLPDPKNCSLYYYCSDDGTSEQYVCPARYVYDTTKFKCKLYQKSSDCATAKCTGLTNYPSYVTFSSNAAYYSLCVKETSGDISSYVFKCADIENYIFDSTQGTCVFQCKADGQFKDIDNCKGYNLCYRSGSVYKVEKHNCPKDMFFNVTTSTCEAGACPT